MKNIYKSLLIIPLVLAFSSCEGFLDTDYDSQIDADSFNKTPEEVYTSLVGCYNGLQRAHYREWGVTEVRSDNTRAYSLKTTTPPGIDIMGLDLASIQVNNLFAQEYWDYTYSNITNCNIVINSLDVIEDEAKRNEYGGEARFIRAYHYFHLVRLYSGVPLVTKMLSVEEANNMGRNSEKDIYDFVQTELETIVNEKMLPVKRGATDLGRVTDVAAKALLAKVYMTRYAVGTSDYLKAKPLLESIVSTLGTGLIPYADIFSQSNEMNNEIIFAVRYASGNKGIGNPFGNEFAPTGSGSVIVRGDGKAFNVPSYDIITSYEPGDKRKEYSLRTEFIAENGTLRDDTPFIMKYNTPGQENMDGEKDWPVIRLADVMLLLAEILNEEGNMSDAAMYTDLIRARAGLAPLSVEDLANKNTLRNAIRDERRFELAFENHRWYDLLRWGIAKDVVNEHYPKEIVKDVFFYEELKPVMDDFRLVLPIPYTVININPDMSQNAGY